MLKVNVRQCTCFPECVVVTCRKTPSRGKHTRVGTPEDRRTSLDVPAKTKNLRKSGQWSDKNRTKSPDKPPENALRRHGDNDQLLEGGGGDKKENVADLVSRFVVSLRVQSNRE